MHCKSPDVPQQTTLAATRTQVYMYTTATNTITGKINLPEHERNTALTSVTFYAAHQSRSLHSNALWPIYPF